MPLEDKQALVDDVFHSVARRYDLMNDLMSLGLHRAWKDTLANAVTPPKTCRLRCSTLPVAPATSLSASSAKAASKPARRCATSMPTCSRLAANAPRRSLGDAITFTEANAETVPFADKSFDAVTIAFGIRNVPRIELALAEAHRVLKIGGRFLCLEFSAVDVPGLDRLYEFYSFNVIPRLGRMVAGDADSYHYLVESIRRFPNPQAFAAMLRTAGLARVSFQPMTGGIVALHSGSRL